MSNYSLHINVKATPEHERLARDIDAVTKRRMTAVYEERERLARLGAAAYHVSEEPYAAYCECARCGTKHYQVGIFGGVALCLACAIRRVEGSAL